MASSSLIVIVDEREPVDADSRLREFGLEAHRAYLDAGDYAFYPHGLVVLIERKTISDLLGSLSSRRMVEQARRMVSQADRSFILREGEFRRLPSGHVGYWSPTDPRARDNWVESGWSWDSFTGMMIDLQLLGIDFIDCPVWGSYAAEIARVVTNVSKDDHKWLRERGRPEVSTIDSTYRDSVWSLCAHTGIGPEYAQGLLAELGTEYNVVRKAVEEPDELAKVKIGRASLGTKRANRLRDGLLQDWSTEK